jgi:hypothetical protein
MADEVQPAEGQGQPVAPAVPAVPVAEPAANDGPWASDLALLGLDDASLGKVDTFLRAKVQPYTTKLEQDVAATRPAATLYNDLTNPEKSVDAYVAITYEMFGQEAGEKLLATLQGQTAEQQQATVAAAVAPAEGTPQYAQLDPETQAFLNEQRQESAERAYEKDLGATIAANPDINPDHLHIWVAQADGDFNKAVELYRQYVADFIAAPAGETGATAPPVLGSDTGGAAASNMPVAPKHQTMEQAVENTVNLFKKQDAPPVVG